LIPRVSSGTLSGLTSTLVLWAGQAASTDHILVIHHRLQRLTNTQARAPGEIREALNLPPWNTAQWVRDVRVPYGGEMYIGDVLGGTGIEVRVSSPSVFIGGPWRPVLPGTGA